MQKVEAQNIILKNSKQVLIRAAKPEDAVLLLDCIKTYIPQSDYIPKYEHEITLTLAQEKEWIQSFLNQDNSLLLVAEYENRIIGNIDLTGSKRIMMQHTAVVGMGMLQNWRNTGLGTALMSEAITWAKANPVLELLYLQVYTENKLGIALYKKMGFVENGIIQNYFKHEDKYFDNLTMSLYVK